MNPKRYRINLTCDSGGACTAYSDDVGVGGEIKQVKYTKTNFSDGVDFVVTGETTGVNIWTENDVNATATRCPRQATHLNTSGAAALYASGGTAVLAPVVISNERIKVVIASGGNATTGAVDVWVG